MPMAIFAHAPIGCDEVAEVVGAHRMVCLYVPIALLKSRKQHHIAIPIPIVDVTPEALL